ncbi:type IV secretion protein Rhs [Escherichia coli]|nr:type IV secretion protein Rhs [Escherichia coli]
MVVVGPLVVHPDNPFRDEVRLLRQPAVFIVAVDIVRIFRDAVNPGTGLPDQNALPSRVV